MGIPEQKIIRSLEGKLNNLKAFYDSLLVKYRNIDLRAITIASAGNTLRSHLFFISMAEFTITRPAWWQEAYRKPYPNAGDQEALSNLDKLGKLSFFVFFLSSIEWTMRKFIARLWTGRCDGGKAEFKSCYDFLLKELGLLQYQSLYDLCRLVRNTIHTGGIFQPRNGKDVVLAWKGSSYSFTDGKPIDFMTHDLVLELYDDLLKSVQDLLSHAAISTPAFIEDKMV